MTKVIICLLIPSTINLLTLNYYEYRVIFCKINKIFCITKKYIDNTVVAGKNNNIKSISNKETIIEADFYDSRMAKAVAFRACICSNSKSTQSKV